MDMGTVTAAVGAVKSITEIAQNILGAKIDSKVQAQVSDIISKAASLQIEMFDIGQKLLSVQEEKSALNAKVAELEEKFDIKNRLEYDNIYYWLVDGLLKDGPFCQKCWDDDAKLMRLHEGRRDSWECKKCKNHYYGPNYQPQRAQSYMPLDPEAGY